MQPQAGKKKKQVPTASEIAASTHIPITVKGQRYVSPEGRHSQQTHSRAQERAAESGHTSEKEHQASDRAATTAKVAEDAAEKVRHHERSKPR